MTKTTDRDATHSYEAGDIVQRKRTGVSVAANATISKGSIGTICRVVNPNRSYMVRFADVPICVLAFHSSLEPTPTGTVGPTCEDDC